MLSLPSSPPVDGGGSEQSRRGVCAFVRSFVRSLYHGYVDTLHCLPSFLPPSCQPHLLLQVRLSPVLVATGHRVHTGAAPALLTHLSDAQVFAKLRPEIPFRATCRRLGVCTRHGDNFSQKRAQTGERDQQTWVCSVSLASPKGRKAAFTGSSFQTFRSMRQAKWRRRDGLLELPTPPPPTLPPKESAFPHFHATFVLRPPRRRGGNRS